MKIGHFQCVVLPDNVEHNLAQIKKGLEFAEKEGISVMSFPECSLTGYVDTAEGAWRNSFPIDSPAVRKVLEMTAKSDVTLIAGLNEQRGSDLYNSCFVAERGKNLGVYSKVFAYMPFHKRGEQFPVFEKEGVKYGIVICADGGYVEPVRILAIKGARIIFAPHFNYVGYCYAIRHYVTVMGDHAARALENGVWFLRGNNVVPVEQPKGKMWWPDFWPKRQPGAEPPAQTGMSFPGVGYGESYIMDPMGEIAFRGERYVECFVHGEVELEDSKDHASGHLSRSIRSSMRFAKPLSEAIAGLPDRPKP